MKILIVTQYFWPEDFRINETISFLTSRNHEVSVLTGKPNYPEGFIFPEYKENPSSFSNYFGAKIYRIPIIVRGKSKIRLALNYLSFIISGTIYGILKFRKTNFDVIFVYEPSPITVGIPAIAISKFTNTPVVFWALDLWPETLEALEIIKSKFMISFFKRVANYIYNNCHLVLCQSRSFVSNITQYVSDRSRVKYFPSWSEDINVSSSIPYADEIKYSPDKFTILFAGNIAEAQDIPSCIDAIQIASKYRNIRWIFLGDGRSFNWLKEEINRRSLEESVQLLGRYPSSMMPSFFKHADALLVTLKKSKAFQMVIPAKVQTYLKAGIPIIGMLDGDGREVIDEASAGMTCRAGDYKELANIFKEISQISNAEKLTMGDNAKKYASKYFDKSLLLARLESYFFEAKNIFK